MTGTVLQGKSTRYGILEKIGTGGFGVVYKAKDLSSSEIVAVKIFMNELDPGNEDALVDWEREATQALAFKHTNIIDSHEFGESVLASGPKIYFLIMDYAENGNLMNFIEAQKSKNTITPEKDILSLLFQILSGLQEVHKTTIHRDLKPENMLFHEEVLKISDFGLAKYVEQSTRTRTFKGSGTLFYMAPEVWKLQTTTHATDIYSLGIILYYLATNDLPYYWSSHDPSEMYDKLKSMHLYDDIPRARSKNPTISHKLDSIIYKMMKKPTTERYQSVKELLDDLDGSVPVDTASIDPILSIAKKLHQKEDQAASEHMKKQEISSNRMKLNNLKIREFVDTTHEIIKEINDSLQEKKLALSMGSATDYTLTWGSQDLIRFSFNPHVFESQLKLPDKLILVHAYAEFRTDCLENEGINFELLHSPENDYGEWTVLQISHDVLSARLHHSMAVEYNVLEEVANQRGMGIYQYVFRFDVKQEIRNIIQKAFEYLDNPPSDDSFSDFIPDDDPGLGY